MLEMQFKNNLKDVPEMCHVFFYILLNGSISGYPLRFANWTHYALYQQRYLCISHNIKEKAYKLNKRKDVKK